MQMSKRLTIEMESGLDVWQKELATLGVMSMSRSLDEALGSGVRLATLTEVCGLPGSAKSQLCMQLCVAVQIPTSLGAQAVYVDTASNFSSRRLRQMVVACKDRINDESLSEAGFMRGVHYLEANGILQFCAAIELVCEFARSNRNVKLVVIDGIAHPFKDDCSDLNKVGTLSRIAAKLKELAEERNLAVVVTNEMSTRPGVGVAGALGDAWAHCIGTRILMSPPNVAVTHCSGRTDSVAKIKVTRDGIRDVKVT